jgi:tetratricopeptide (TPR) repeat protein
MSRIVRSAALVALVLVCASPVLGQDWAGHGRAQGIVKDPQGKPVVGAKVTLRKGSGRVEADKPGPPALKTDKSGRWSTLGLADGAWGVLIEADGFITSEGQIQVSETGPPQPPIIISLKSGSSAPAAAESKEPPKPSKTSLANQSIVKGNELLNQQKYAEARAEYAKALELIEKPADKPQLLRAVASTYYKESTEAKSKDEKAQKVDLAVVELKQALEIQPDDADTMQLMVNLLVSVGRDAEAQTYIAKMPAGKVDPDTMLNIGIKYYNAKQLDKALDEFTQVIALNPNLPDPYYYRALVYLNLGKTPEAKADFKKLLEIDPNNKNAKEAKEFLSSL